MNYTGTSYREVSQQNTHPKLTHLSPGLDPHKILEELTTLQLFVDRLESQHAEEKRKLVSENTVLRRQIEQMSRGGLQQRQPQLGDSTANLDYTEILLKEKNSDIIVLRETIYSLTEAKKKAELQLHDLQYTMENKLKNTQIELQSKEIDIQRLKNDLLDAEERMDKQNRRERSLIEGLSLENAKMRQRLGLATQELEETEQRVYQIKAREKQASDELLNTNFERRIRNRLLFQSSNVIWCLKQMQSRKTVSSAFELWRSRFLSAKRKVQVKQADSSKKFNDVVKRVRVLSGTLRDKTVRFAFDIFANSVAKSSKTKQNSLNVFTKDFADSKDKLYTLYKTTVEGYMIANEIVTSYCLDEALYLNPMNIAARDLDDQNKWVLQNLISLLNNPQLDMRSAKNREKEQVLTLYRLFLLLHKANSPTTRKSTELDPKLKEALYHCILLHLRDIVEAN